MFKIKSENYWAVITIPHKRMVDERKNVNNLTEFDSIGGCAKNRWFSFDDTKCLLSFLGISFTRIWKIVSLFFDDCFFLSALIPELGFVQAWAFFRMLGISKGLGLMSQLLKRMRNTNVRKKFDGSTRISLRILCASWTNTRKQNWERKVEITESERDGKSVANNAKSPSGTEKSLAKCVYMSKSMAQQTIRMIW